MTAASLALSYLNLRHLARHGREVPEELALEIDRERLAKISAYTTDRARFGLVSSCASSVVVLGFVFGGFLERYDGFVTGVSESFLLHGVLFFMGLSALETLAALPFSIYSQFVIEARHGFNRMSPGLFVRDTLKNLALAALLGGIAASAALWLVAHAPQTWWLWVWAFFVGFGLLLTYLAPILIEPLFFKIEPLRVDGLEARVRALAERAGVRLSAVLQMDASRRSAHSNAYFTGIGRVKRVVLFDTLLAQLEHSEILSVLAHELGHWQKQHVLKRMLLMYAVALGLAYAAFRLSASPYLPGLIGASELSFPARISVLALVGSVVSFLLTPLSSWWSRSHEREADVFASELSGEPDKLASALAKMSRENLSNLHPHPLYAAFYYSHPPVVERLRSLRALASANTNGLVLQ
jgi:STE24 endopeptidase